MLELLIDNATSGSEEVIAGVRRQVRWLFVEKGERYPWAYAQHHCTTAANIYSLVHWKWVRASSGDRN